ncbi:MAG: hypothetical protein ACFFB3_15575 [Candidatus Hodarchaeota archaeon]
MSQFLTDDLLDRVRTANFAKHAVMRSVIREHAKDIDESSLNALLMKIYRLFYDKSMVDSLFGEIQEREEQKRNLQQMDLEDLASLAVGADIGETTGLGDVDLPSLMVINETTVESLMAIAETISEEEVYRTAKEMKISVIIDFFSAFQGSSSSVMGAIDDFTEVDRKRVLDMFSLFVETQFDEISTADEQLGRSLGSSALSVDLIDQSFAVFIYTPKKWLDKGETQRLSLGLMIDEEGAKFVPLMSNEIVKRLERIANTILGTTREDLLDVQFRLMDLSIRETLSAQIKSVSDFITRLSLALQQMTVSE